MPKISVIMPIYNTHPAHLRQAVESILTQTCQNFEFLILNDSPENLTLERLVLAYRDPRIIYLKNPQNLGIAQSYNRLLESARAPYVALMNHDDIATPQRFAKQLAYLKAHPEVGLIGTGYKKFGELNRFKTITPPAEDSKIRALMLFKSPIHHPTIMFRRHLVFKHHIRYNENYISLNDRQFYYDISKVAKLANLRDTLYKYRFHPDMTSKTHKSAIHEEQQSFHQMWFKDNDIHLTAKELAAFECYAANGRCRIHEPEVMEDIRAALEHLVTENEKRGFVPKEEFAAICAKYLEKRCLNAALYGKISTRRLLKSTPLPVHPPLLLNLANYALSWRN